MPRRVGHAAEDLMAEAVSFFEELEAAVEEVPQAAAVAPDDFLYYLTTLEYTLVVLKAHGKEMTASELRQFVKCQLVLAHRSLRDRYPYPKRYTEDKFTRDKKNCEVEATADRILQRFRLPNGGRGRGWE